MTKRRESRSGRNQVIWDKALHWGKKEKISERSGRRGRSREEKGWRFFLIPRPPLGSLCSPIFLLFELVFYLLPPLLETKRQRGGFLPSLFPSHDSLASFSCSLSLNPWTTGVVVCDRKNRGLTKTMTVWFKGTAMGTLYCSPYLKLNIFRSNPGGRPKRTFRFLKCFQVINKNAGTSFKAFLGQIIKTIPLQGDISYHAACLSGV